MFKRFFGAALLVLCFLTGESAIAAVPSFNLLGTPTATSFEIDSPTGLTVTITSGGTFGANSVSLKQYANGSVEVTYQLSADSTWHIVGDIGLAEVATTDTITTLIYPAASKALQLGNNFVDVSVGAASAGKFVIFKDPSLAVQIVDSIDAALNCPFGQETVALQALKDAKAASDAKAADLQTKLNAAVTTISTLTVQNATLTQQNTDLIAALAQANADKASLLQQLNTANTTIATQNDTIKNLTFMLNNITVMAMPFVLDRTVGSSTLDNLLALHEDGTMPSVLAEHAPADWKLILKVTAGSHKQLLQVTAKLPKGAAKPLWKTATWLVEALKGAEKKLKEGTQFDPKASSYFILNP